MSEASTLLLGELLAEVETRGPIPFARFMERCLYHPRFGYYTRGLGGGGGRDYLTSSGTHRAFGVLLARQVEEMWSLLERPERFSVIEFGPGEGVFAADLLREAARHEEFARALEYVLVEPSPVLRERQKARLAGAARGPVVWASETDLEQRRGRLTGCLFANEVVDAFPVHRVIGTSMGLREVHVAAANGRLVEVLQPPSDAAIETFLEAAGVRLENGQEVDLNLAAPRWVAGAVGLLARGYAIIVDYGYEARELYDPARRRGTLLAYHRHRFSEDYLRLPGEQDLTAHVDFTALEQAAGRAGARRLGLVTQSRLLLALGAVDLMETIPEAGTTGASSLAEMLREREALKDLILPGRMGERFRALLLARGAVPEDLTGLRAPWEQVGAVGMVSQARPPGHAGGSIR